MRAQAMSVWACPNDGHYPLELKASTNSSQDIHDGSLRCARCGRTYLLSNGLPNFLLFEEAPSAQVKRAEQQARAHELAMTTDLFEAYEAQLETEAVLSRLRPTAHDYILDAGCGFGRLTREVLKFGAQVVAIDFSMERLNVLRSLTPSANTLDLAIADLNHLPLRSQTFTRIVCTQVLEHLPTLLLRRAFLQKLFDLLAPGGELVLTAYNYHQGKRRRGEPKEGFHDSGIFYHCYEAEELRAELCDWQLIELCGVFHELRGTYKFKLLPRLGVLGRAFDHTLEKFSTFSVAYGSLLLAHALKP
jgi:SAM-dependent methyltransferase